MVIGRPAKTVCSCFEGTAAETVRYKRITEATAVALDHEKEIANHRGALELDLTNSYQFGVPLWSAQSNL